MTAVLPMANTGFSYISDPNTGMRRTGADVQAIYSGGTDIVEFTSTAMNVLTSLQVGGVPAFPISTAVITDNAVTYAKIQEVAASRLLGNPTGALTEVSEVSLGTGLEFSGTSIKAVSVVPTIQRFTSGSGTYTTPANVKWIRIRMAGGGGGGGGGNNSGISTAGGASTFSILTAGGGGAASTAVQGSGGSASNGNILNINGGSGSGSNGSANGSGAAGGNSYLGGGGGGGLAATGGGLGASANSGSGGGGGSFSAAPASGGGAGAYVEHIIGSPAASYSYAVGAGGAGAVGSGGGGAGGAGAAGIIIVEEYY